MSACYSSVRSSGVSQSLVNSYTSMSCHVSMLRLCPFQRCESEPARVSDAGPEPAVGGGARHLLSGAVGVRAPLHGGLLSAGGNRHGRRPAPPPLRPDENVRREESRMGRRLLVLLSAIVGLVVSSLLCC